VSALARAYLDGLQSAGVIGCGKHFPGLGRALLDTHARLPEVDVALEELIAHDLIPYLRLREHLKMVMVSHAAYPGLQRKPFTRLGPDEGGAAVPASCSPAVYQLLRNAIGFSEIAVTDDLEMGAVQESIGAEEIAVRAFRAGADLLLTGRRLDFALLCRERLAALLEQPFWRQQALARLDRLETVPVVPSVDLERIKVLADQFRKWKEGLGLG
jgi:beta-N-acetylhexosaminidase